MKKCQFQYTRVVCGILVLVLVFAAPPFRPEVIR